MAEAELSIGEVAQQAGINVSAIRFYEREGLLPAADSVSGQRRFDEARDVAARTNSPRDERAVGGGAQSLFEHRCRHLVKRHPCQNAGLSPMNP